MSDDSGIGSLVASADTPLFGNDGSPSIRSVLDYKAPTFAESMANTTDEHLAEMEERGDYYTARFIRKLREAAKERLGER